MNRKTALLMVLLFLITMLFTGCGEPEKNQPNDPQPSSTGYDETGNGQENQPTNSHPFNIDDFESALPATDPQPTDPPATDPQPNQSDNGETENQQEDQQENQQDNQQENQETDAQTETKISAFSTTNLYGQKITQDIFARYDLTMINIFATWCNPCIAEMPELAKVHKKLPKNVNLLGICSDAREELALAQDIVRVTKVSYEILIPDESLRDNLLTKIDFYPTTIFVDKEGRYVGDPILGVPQAKDLVKAYLKEINTRLNALEK
jgi:thiol-disulfide isomerase/thioredoxin